MYRVTLQVLMQCCRVPLLLLFVAGCTSIVNPPATSTEVRYGGQVFVFPPPSAPEGAFHATQQLQGRFADRQETAIVEIENHSDKLVMVALSSWGANLFSIIYDHQGIHLQQGLQNGAQIPAPYILADYMLTYWPLEQIQQAFHHSALRITETIQDSQRIRLLSLQDKTLVRIHYSTTDPWRSNITLQNLELNYELAIRTMSKESL